MDKIVTQSLRSHSDDENITWWEASAMMVMILAQVNASTSELV